MTQPRLHVSTADVDKVDASSSTSVRALLDAVDVREPIDTVCDQVASAWALISGASHVGVLILDARGERTRHRGASSTAARVLDDQQLATEQGPLVEVMRGRRPRRGSSIDERARWPSWSRTADAWSVVAARVIPLGPGAGWVEFVSLYFEHPRSHARPDTTDVAAALAATLLDAAFHIHSLRRALETRGHIGQAQGVLMERHSIDEAGAMGVLRRLSQHQNVKLSAVARNLVTSSRSRSGRGTATSEDPTFPQPRPPVPAPPPAAGGAT